ncbi:MAG: replication initiator protein A [Pseudobutyrivibrio sp.]|nr:replication initiator protein A [Pseudobutyrivibrio sp.]MCF0185896.1 replication initiator protein A [Bacteroidaceae bacterium]
MNFDYFYSEQSEQFAFYRIPKLLYTDARFKGMTSDAKTLYGLLLDRVSLSVKNGWVDEQGRIFVYCTLESVEAALGCAEQKALKLLSELEAIGLIEKKRQGLGKPNRIYVKNFIEPRISLLKNNDNHGSGTVNFSALEPRISLGNKTDINNTESSKTNPFISEEMEERESYRQYFSKQLEVDYLMSNNPYDRDQIEEILEIILDTVCSKRSVIRIAGDDKPAEVVRGRLMKLDCSHIEFVIAGLKENSTKVRNIKQYILASLYNAPMTISNYYQALYNNDHANGRV